MIKIMCRLSRYPWGFCFWVQASAARRYKSKPFGRAHYSSWGSKVQYKLWIIGFFGGLIINGETKTSKVLGKNAQDWRKIVLSVGWGWCGGGCDSSSKQQLLTAVAKYLHSIGGNASPADCWDKDGDLKWSLDNIQPGNQNSAEFNFCNLPTLPQESDGQLENKKV